jgi:hypothetical protein
MEENLEVKAKTKPSYKIRLEDFEAFEGMKTYKMRNMHWLSLRNSKEAEYCATRRVGLFLFNFTMVEGVIYLENYIISLLR